MSASVETKKKNAANSFDFKGKHLTKQQEMNFTYTSIDKLVRYSLGQNADFENALYNGDYSISLEDAQRRKHEFICDQLGIYKGSKVLDLGCGWGGFLKYLKEIGAEGIGVNLSAGQITACLKSGLNAYLKDVRDVTPADFGVFDAVTAIGSFDHIASLEDYLEGRQDEVYDNYFSNISNLLTKGKRFYIQSMVFSRNMIAYEDISLKAPKDSTAYIMALLLKHFPNSWLPYGIEHIIRTAAPYFKVVHQNSGRLDFIETNKQWKKRFLQFNFRKYLWFLSLLPEYLINKEFRYQVEILKIRPNRICFEREIFDQARIVFEKI
jgi:cyclopropane-fatty-acyl-phospholipid synthase